MRKDIAQEANPVEEPSRAAPPDAEVRKMDDNTFSILLERVKVDECWDQSREVQMGQGCIGSPGSPGC